MKVINDDLIFSTGKKVYANMGIIGIGVTEDNTIYLSEGSDGGIDDEQLTPQEREEIADYCIDLWTKFKTNASSEEK